MTNVASAKQIKDNRSQVISALSGDSSSMVADTRPRGGGSFSSQALYAQHAQVMKSAEEVSVTLNPGHNKGPNHPYLPIDNFVKNVQPMQWNNIPVPLCETIADIQQVFAAVKQTLHDHYNDIVMT